MIPAEVVAEIDLLVGKRARSQFLVRAAELELKRHRQMAALKDAVGAWDPSHHPELKGGALAFQRKLRAESDRRIARPRTTRTR